MLDINLSEVASNNISAANSTLCSAIIVKKFSQMLYGERRLRLHTDSTFICDAVKLAAGIA